MLTGGLFLSLLVFLAVLLGPYWIRAEYRHAEDDHSGAFSISSLWNLLCLDWRTEPEGSLLGFSIFHRRIWRKRFGWKQPDETEEPADLDESGESISPFPFKLVFRLRKNIWRILRCFQLKHMEIHGTFGTGDPASTGMLYGFTQPLQAALGFRWIDWKPDFFEPKATGQIDLAFRFMMGSILMRSIGLAALSVQLLRKEKT
jgi:hypothetical protein